jgi:DNA-binding ferritin-like protein
MSAPLRKNLIDLLATLTAIKWHSWVTHWKSQGAESYSDHLLFQRIYEGSGGGPKIDDQIDGLGERIIALFGNEAVDGVAVTQKAAQIHQSVKSLKMVAGALKLEEKALAAATKVADKVSKGPANLRISLDNFVRELADARSTVVYLLQQRLKGGAVDNFGALGALGEEGSIASVLSYVVGGVVVGTAATSYGYDKDPALGAKMGAAAGLAMALFKLGDEAKEDDYSDGFSEFIEGSEGRTTTLRLLAAGGFLALGYTLYRSQST